MKQITSVKDCKEWCQAHNNIGFVPTMGALHAGHLKLVETAKTHCKTVVVSIFVNPKQFDNKADLEKYPQTLEHDITQLEALGVAMLFLPKAAEIYPDNFQTIIGLPKFDTFLCGVHRPGHFNGVATILTKFFNIIQPQKAFFGEKDFQQLMLVQQLVQDLDIETEIIGVETMREGDGLAMSSRNRRLSKEGRQHATVISKVLQSIKSIDDIPAAKQQILNAGFSSIDYFEIHGVNEKPRIFVAANIEGIRLIDNMPIKY